MHKLPLLYEVNAAFLFSRMRKRLGKKISLAEIPRKEWKSLKASGIDLVWLMGVWRRSPQARKKALEHPDLRSAYSRILPGWTDEDVWGSPYAVYDYSLESRFGDPAGELAALRGQLNKMGMKLILDFVPNHLAMDHPWTLQHPERFIQGHEPQRERHPEWFFRTPQGAHLAHGRDPYFPPWSDTVQVNIAAGEMREAMIAELLKVAEVCDGVRCDMAMLLLNNVFSKVWQECLDGTAMPGREFWDEAVSAVRAQHPSFLFMAEVYWDLEKELQALGFDFTYDKRVYDHLKSRSLGPLKEHLKKGPGGDRRSVHFVENHDEARAVTAFGKEASLAAAAATATLPGMRFFYDGQWEGREVHVPIQLGEAPEETAGEECRVFYERLLNALRRPLFHRGQWILSDLSAGDEAQNVLSWVWRLKDQWAWVVINYSDGPFRLDAAAPECLALESGSMSLGDLLSPEHSAELLSGRILLEMKAWESRILAPV